MRLLDTFVMSSTLASGIFTLTRRRIIKDEDLLMHQSKLNTHLPECWLHYLVGPRRFRAVLPSNRRPSLFGSD